MAYTIKAVLDALPEGRKRGAGKGAVDYTEELALIGEIPMGKVLEIDFGPKDGATTGVSFRAFSAKIRSAARNELKMTVDAVYNKGSVYLSKADGVKARAPRRTKAQKEADALAAQEAAA